MSASTNTRSIQWESELTPQKLEYAFGLASRAQMAKAEYFAEAGMRAARARDPKFLKALEKMAEDTGRLEEDQMKQTKREANYSSYGQTRGTTEHQLCREAYRMVDQGTPIANFQWIYGAAAWLCGYVLQP